MWRQALGENVMLLRVLLEAVGTSARAIGPRFATAGRLLRTVLLPTLERLGEQIRYSTKCMCLLRGTVKHLLELQLHMCTLTSSMVVRRSRRVSFCMKGMMYSIL